MNQQTNHFLMVWIHVYGSLCMQEVRAYMLYSKLSLQIVCSKWKKRVVIWNMVLYCLPCSRPSKTTRKDNSYPFTTPQDIYYAKFIIAFQINQRNVKWKDHHDLLLRVNKLKILALSAVVENNLLPYKRNLSCFRWFNVYVVLQHLFRLFL